MSEKSFLNKFGVNKKCETLVRGEIPVAIRRPNEFEFIRTLADVDMMSECYLIMDKDDENGINNIFYILSPEVAEEINKEIGDRVKLYYLQIAISHHGSTFVWPLKTFGLTNNSNSWNNSAWEAVKIARNDWVKVFINLKKGKYITRKAPPGKYSEPLWPSESYEEMLNKFFQERMIESLDDPNLINIVGMI